MTLRINEIFCSIQGESTFAGSPCVFVRLSGCNLRCSYCDTQYAYDNGEDIDLDNVLARLDRYRCKLVEITGGEPLLQQETPVLVKRLLDLGYTVLLETNGTMNIDQVDRRCIRIVDIKCPSSGQTEHTDFKNLDRLTGEDELKFVIGMREDYLYGKKIVAQIMSASTPVRCIHFVPVWGKLQPAVLATWILEDSLKVKLGVQLHKILWPDKYKGV